MPRGPLPDPNARRRNAPTIPTTELPAGGRIGRPPNPPKGYELGPCGKAWWRWAWATPQAAAWDKGALYVVARRAVLEDDMDAVANYSNIDLAELLDLEHSERVDAVQAMVRTIGRVAGGRTNLMKEARELEGKLGLTPAALAALRWKIVSSNAKDAPKPAAKQSKRRARLELVS